MSDQNNNRVILAKGFTTAPNDFIRCELVSSEARFLMILLASFSSSWTFRRKHLMGITGWGRQKYDKNLNELKKHGLVVIEPTKSENGRFSGQSWLLDFERRPTDEVIDDNTDGMKNRPSVFTTGGKTKPHKKNNNNKKNNTKKTNIPSDLSIEASVVREDAKLTRLDREFLNLKDFWDLDSEEEKNKAKAAFIKARSAGIPAQAIIDTYNIEMETDGRRRFGNFLFQQGWQDWGINDGKYLPEVKMYSSKSRIDAMLKVSDEAESGLRERAVDDKLTYDDEFELEDIFRETANERFG